MKAVSKFDKRKNLRNQMDIVSFIKDPNLFNFPSLNDPQETLIRYAYGLPLEPVHRQWLKKIDPALDPTYRREFSEQIYILGRRSFKTTLAASIAIYEAIFTDWKPYLRPGELAWIFIYSVRLDNAADIGGAMVEGAIKASPFLREFLVTDKKELEDYHLPDIRGSNTLVFRTGAAVKALPCRARAGKGYPCSVLILDELAWYKRASSVADTDREIYDSAVASQIQFGDLAKTVLISTPADRSGVLYEKWKAREKNRDLYFIVRAPTELMRPDIPNTEFKKLRRKIPMTYDREFGAKFMSSVEPLLLPSWIAKCVEKYESLPPRADVMYEMSIDSAFSDKDRFGFAIGHLEQRSEDDYTVVIDVVDTIDEGLENDVHDQALKILPELYLRYNIFEIGMDQYHAETFAKTLENKGMNSATNPWSQARRRSAYGLLRTLIKQRRIRLPNNQILIDELEKMQVKFSASSAAFTVHHPPGGHDDCADCVADIAYRLCHDMVDEVGIDNL